eukprot:GFUD01018141.1.p1 GENE.GFUD01018141.1~~GFUD01018141.1.p1  ORF type:complete len:176 (+),score=35.96 GFUD01018141.1:206-733(+)
MSAQNMDSSAQQGFPTLCNSGCGFFSSVDSKGLCSVCYKAKQKKERPSSEESTSSTSMSNLHQQTTLSENILNIEPAESKCEASSEVVTQTPSTSGNPEEEKDEPIPAKKPKKSRCLNCKKKLGLTGFTCRCGGLFCSIHRYSDKHECNFDYNAMGKKEIRENNPVIVAQKVAKI